MLCHVHVTVPDNHVVPKGAKRTDIVLEGIHLDQRDIMLTKHYKVESNPIEYILKDIRSWGLPQIIRIKIEQDDDFHLPVSDENYAEIHMLCSEGITPVGSAWVKSRNPRRVGMHFFNRRIYHWSSMEDLIEKVLEEQGGVSYTDLKIEQVLFDSNRELDNWWA